MRYVATVTCMTLQTALLMFTSNCTSYLEASFEREAEKSYTSFYVSCYHKDGLYDPIVRMTQGHLNVR
jgi:hypothetical protein